MLAFSSRAQLVQHPTVNARFARDEGLIPGSGTCPGIENGSPLQCSCPENFMDREAYQTYKSMGFQRIGQDLAAEHTPHLREVRAYMNENSKKL